MSEKRDPTERDERDQSESIGLEEDLEVSEDQVGSVVGGVSGDVKGESTQTPIKM